MKTFAYSAYTSSGRRRRGHIQAPDEAEVARRLAAQGLVPGKIAESSAAISWPGSWFSRRIDKDALSVFTRQFVVLLAAGLTVEVALEAVQETAGASKTGRLASEARAALLEGGSLAEALEKAANGLPAWYLAAVRSGESAGDFLAVFSSLADHMESRAQDRAAIATALVYPAFVTVVAVTVSGVLMVTVLPEITAMFEASNHPLPALTVLALAVVEGVRTGWPLIVAGLLAVTVSMVAIARTPGLRQRRDGVLLRFPLVGRLIRMSSAASYLRTFALVVNSRLPLTDALEHAADVLAIRAFHSEATQASQLLRRGESLTTALAGISFLHPVAKQLLQAGEASGKLDTISSRAADLAENWLSADRKRLTTILEPAAMVAVGLLVLSVVLAILLPIFDLQSLIAG